MTRRTLAPLVVATGNPDKVREVVEILAETFDHPLCAAALNAADGATVGFVVASPDEIAGVVASLPALSVAPDVVETGSTLEANALIKARAVATALRFRCVADDTGLEVDALGGAPGVLSARYAGPLAGAADNCEKLQREIGRQLRASRTARFVTVAVLYDPANGEQVVARGKVEGVIVDTPRGANGFGYDPLFAPAGGNGRTFAEMSPAAKHRLSHRGRAFRELTDALAGANTEKG